MQIKLYESMGMLAHERRPVYSDRVPATDCYDVVTVDIPYTLSENEAGETLIDLDGQTCLLAEVLSNSGDKPCIAWFDGKCNRREILEVL